MASGQTKTAVIAAGGTTSTAVLLGGMTLVGLDCPTTDSTSLGAEVSSDGGVTWRTMILDNTGPVALGVYLILPASSTGNKYVAINPNYFLGVDYVRFVAGSSQSSGAVTFTLHLKAIQ